MGIAVAVGALTDAELISTAAPPPRGSYWAGILIDDHCGFEKESCDPGGLLRGERLPAAAPPDPSRAAQAFAAMRETYPCVHLAAHQGKAASRSFLQVRWGAYIDGVRGWVSAPPAKTLALSLLTLRVVLVGFCHVALLWMLEGSWTYVLMYRRRALCLLFEVYKASSGRDPGEVVWLSPALRSELFSLATLAPWLGTDMRADFADRIDLVDASPWRTAGVSAPLAKSVVQELSRHCIRRGRWTQLISSRKSLLRGKGLLEIQDELPEGEEVFSCSPWVKDLVTSLRFKTDFISNTRGREHINIGEVRAHTSVERRAAVERPNTRLCVGADSQVQLGSVAKGRSSSPQINWPLQKSLPSVLGGKYIFRWVLCPFQN
jgi:hypothetical protein